MAQPDRVRQQLLLREAEGYLELALALSDRWTATLPARQRLSRRLLATLDQLPEPLRQRPHALFMRGQAHKFAEAYGEAIRALSEAAECDEENIHVLLALAWCQKRVGRVDLAAAAMEQALRADPEEPILHYNLACYWGLLGDAGGAVRHLSRAIDLKPQYRDLVLDETDFDPIRHDPRFQAILAVNV